MVVPTKSFVGLDIGSRQLKIVEVSIKKNTPIVVQHFVTNISEMAVNAGTILNTQYLGEKLGEISKDINIKGKKVITQVYGKQVFSKILVMPYMNKKEIKKAAGYMAATFSPIPINNTYYDVHPIRVIESENVKKVEVFYVAAKRDQIDALKNICKIAGLKLAAVDIEPLAVNRLLNEDIEFYAYLNIGSSCSTFALLSEGIPLFIRNIPFGVSTLYENFNIDELSQLSINDILLQDPDLIRSLLLELQYSIDFAETKPEILYIVGGGAKIRDVSMFLENYLSIKIGNLNMLESLALKSVDNSNEKDKFKSDLAIALGLAMRGVS
ncbi:hypothetical protein SYNTR_0347 [Candidatus Syntrophocurvum alkaliphilum]|uniref:SHS2 domain-containing protein n=1 Tax=Candidatus Syntrophocurvum alkaliphilum TaxID=2293317 RepID=A0A6I6DCT7_9FIRM|nr:pilus assembly protein PilM [Candidatus Syntrophocurvum alkaliphilum]QGT98940.1 hypothetical protein SYNTR_0347 [Candidatus Syntrophocurvum alkaliphilum]